MAAGSGHGSSPGAGMPVSVNGQAQQAGEIDGWRMSARPYQSRLYTRIVILSRLLINGQNGIPLRPLKEDERTRARAEKQTLSSSTLRQKSRANRRDVFGRVRDSARNKPRF